MLNKIYLYILISEKSVYACTTDKHIAKMFEEQRNMELFIKKKITGNESIIRTYIQSYNNENLMDLKLWDGEFSTSCVMTAKEAYILQESSYNILSDIMSIKNDMENIPDKDKLTRDTIEYLSLFCMKDDKIGCLESYLNEYRLFYDLFKNTFERC